MEFLYSLNRLNVAVSRAQCVAVIVASPALRSSETRCPLRSYFRDAVERSSRYKQLTCPETIRLVEGSKLLGSQLHRLFEAYD